MCGLHGERMACEWDAAHGWRRPTKPWLGIGGAAGGRAMTAGRSAGRERLCEGSRGRGRACSCAKAAPRRRGAHAKRCARAAQSEILVLFVVPAWEPSPPSQHRLRPRLHRLGPARHCVASRARARAQPRCSRAAGACEPLLVRRLRSGSGLGEEAGQCRLVPAGREIGLQGAALGQGRGGSKCKGRRGRWSSGQGARHAKPGGFPIWVFPSRVYTHTKTERTE